MAFRAGASLLSASSIVLIAALAAPPSAHAVDSGAAAAAALLKQSAPLTTGAIPPKAATGTVDLGKSGLPVPRFVSLKSGKVNVRNGPGEGYSIAWTFTRASLPVEVIAEFDTWRRVRDSDGSVGWVLQNLLSSKRTAVVAPWSAGEPKPLHTSPSDTGAVAAYVEAGIQADVASCHANWCKLTGRGFSGWIEQTSLWGVYPGEEIP